MNTLKPATKYPETDNFLFKAPEPIEQVTAKFTYSILCLLQLYFISLDIKGYICYRTEVAYQCSYQDVHSSETVNCVSSLVNVEIYSDFIIVISFFLSLKPNYNSKQLYCLHKTD